ncbi:MAG TPA: hypothetical protein VFO25_06120 [Candidatus Eremiobacteraceae bacterium]|nr:hypothetical protein [Candidatus Eremiobacteraceae bacterium]
MVRALTHKGLLIVIAVACGATMFDPCAVRAVEEPQPVGDAPITVSATRVEYYSDLALVVARGDASVELPDGAAVHGDVFLMDLRQQRLVVAGHVTLSTREGTYSGAAFADFLAFKRSYFIPLDPADRWTYLASDYAHPQLGRQMPGDAFFLTGVGGHHPYVVGKSAIIDPNAYVSFEPAIVDVLDVLPTPPLPSFVDNFSSDPSFGENSLPGATLDAPYTFYGTPHSLDAFHLRYDQSLPVKGYIAYEHHSVFGDRGYAVFSLVPATQPDKQWNLLAYDPAGPVDAFALQAQLFTTQSGFAAPTSAHGFVDLRLLHVLRQSSVQLDATDMYDTLLAQGQPDHPSIVGIDWSSFDEPIWRTGIELRLRSGIATMHDAFGVAGSSKQDVLSEHIGATAASPVVPGPLGFGFDATAGATRTWLSFPNTIDTATVAVSAARALAPRVYSTLTWSVGTLDASSPTQVVISPNVTTGLTPTPLSPNGLPVFGVPSIYRRTTSRAYALIGSWQPSPEFQFSSTLQKTAYSPVQLPAPLAVTATARMRLTKSLYVSVARSYFFNFEGQRWSPQFVLQVTGQ